MRVTRLYRLQAALDALLRLTDDVLEAVVLLPEGHVLLCSGLDRRPAFQRACAEALRALHAEGAGVVEDESLLLHPRGVPGVGLVTAIPGAGALLALRLTDPRGADPVLERLSLLATALRPSTARARRAPAPQLLAASAG